MHRTTAHPIVKLQLSGSTRAPLNHTTLYNELLCYHSCCQKYHTAQKISSTSHSLQQDITTPASKLFCHGCYQKHFIIFNPESFIDSVHLLPCCLVALLPCCLVGWLSRKNRQQRCNMILITVEPILF